MKPNRLNAILACAAAGLLLIGGCAGDGKSNNATQREVAQKQWNQARAGVMHSLARDQFRTGSLDKARQTCDQALAMDPDSVPLLILSAQIAMEQSQLEVADAALVKARTLQPKNGEALYLSGVVAQRWQKHEDACNFYTAAADAQPTELAYLMARAEVLVLLDRRPEALAILREKVPYFENSAALRDAVGQLLMQERKYDEAVEMFRQASVLATEEIGVRERLALAYFHTANYRDCADTLRRLVQDEPYRTRADLFIALGESQLAINQNVESRMSFQRATELDPSSVAAWMGLTKAALTLGDLRRAELAAHKAVALAPNRADAHLTFGYVRLKQQRLEEALISFRRASAIDPNDSVSLSMIGYVLGNQGRHAEAMGYYGKALQVNPKDELAAQLMVSAPLD